MKILVTGANGYIGNGVVTKLIDKGYDVVATDLAADYIDKRAEIIVANIFNVENPFDFFGKPDAVLHLAWRDGFKHFSDAHYEDLPKHYHFLKQLSESHIGKICVLGTMHEIGFFEGEVDEDTPTNPRSPYGICKDALRNSTISLAQTNGNIWQWLRGFYIVGYLEKGESIFSKLVRAEKRGESTFPFTSGKNQFDFIDYDTFCNQVACAVGQNNITGIINCCSGVPQRLSDVVERFLDNNKMRISLDYGKYPDRLYESKMLWGNSSRIKEIVENEKNIKKTVD